MCLVYGLWTPFGAPCPFSALEPLHFKLRGLGSVGPQELPVSGWRPWLS